MTSEIIPSGSIAYLIPLSDVLAPASVCISGLAECPGGSDMPHDMPCDI